jgi:hypothetical protein
MTPDLQLALTRAAVLSLVGTAGGRDVWMSGPADDLGAGVPAALIATAQGELVPDCVAGRASARRAGHPPTPPDHQPGYTHLSPRADP